jgi:hypothetical protein
LIAFNAATLRLGGKTIVENLDLDVRPANSSSSSAPQAAARPRHCGSPLVSIGRPTATSPSTASRCSTAPRGRYRVQIMARRCCLGGLHPQTSRSRLGPAAFRGMRAPQSHRGITRPPTRCSQLSRGREPQLHRACARNIHRSFEHSRSMMEVTIEAIRPIRRSRSPNRADRARLRLLDGDRDCRLCLRADPQPHRGPRHRATIDGAVAGAAAETGAVTANWSHCLSPSSSR